MGLMLTNLPTSQRFDVAPTTQQMLGPFTVFCLIMNRTIGTGIFTQPVNVLRETGSSGVALAVWCLAGIVILCVVVCWLELGLSVPIYNIFWNGAWTKVSTPRSGGDKNYVRCCPSPSSNDTTVHVADPCFTRSSSTSSRGQGT